MTDKAINQAWLVILIVGALLAVIVAVRAPTAHCHGGDCHVHAAGVR